MRSLVVAAFATALWGAQAFADVAQHSRGRGGGAALGFILLVAFVFYLLFAVLAAVILGVLEVERRRLRPSHGMVIACGFVSGAVVTAGGAVLCAMALNAAWVIVASLGMLLGLTTATASAFAVARRNRPPSAPRDETAAT